MFRKYFLPYFVFIFYRLWSSTWKVTVFEPESFKNLQKENKRFILGHWHGDELTMLFFVKTYRLATMTSTSKDGELINKIIHLFGGNTSRGSSTRGSIAGLKGLINLIRKQNYNCNLALDGPKGPYHKVKPGVFEIAKMLKLPIYVSGVYYTDAIHFPKAWNKAFFPKLFASVYIHWEGPFFVDEDEDLKSPELALRLESLLDAAHASAVKGIADLSARC